VDAVDNEEGFCIGDLVRLKSTLLKSGKTLGLIIDIDRDFYKNNMKETIDRIHVQWMNDHMDYSYSCEPANFLNLLNRCENFD
jgi:hypothetical protein